MKEASEMIKIGEKVPEIALEGTNGESVSLQAFADQGKKLVLFFYPKDNTSG
jgi:peroxiredoxin Q/BCP